MKDNMSIQEAVKLAQRKSIREPGEEFFVVYHADFDCYVVCRQDSLETFFALETPVAVALNGEIT